MTSEEKRQHSSQLVPFSYYKSHIPDYFANVPLHWHGEFEINFIISGCAEFTCGDSRFISETDKTSVETAFECGFRNLSNFNRQFRKIVGCTPTEYRKINA